MGMLTFLSIKQSLENEDIASIFDEIFDSDKKKENFRV